jgi:hypothetical protein
MIVLVLGPEVLMEPLVFPFEPAVLAAMRVSGVPLLMECLVLGV